MKTLWIEDEDALNVGRVIVTKTGTKDCVVCYSCDEIDDYEARLKADMVAMLTELKKEIEEQCKIPNNNASAYDWNNGVYACYKAVQQKIDAMKMN